MLWGAKTDLAFPNRFQTAQWYLHMFFNLLSYHRIAGALGENFHQMDDNAHPHTAQTVINWLEDDVLPQ